MRWMKHLSTAHQDEKITLLIAEFGALGYGVFWIILEIIATQVDESDRDFAVHPEIFWRQKTGLSAKKLSEILHFFQKNGIFCVDFEKNGEKKSQNLITIRSPNILKYRDEHSRKKVRNSGVTPESLRSKETDTDTDNAKEDANASPLASERAKPSENDFQKPEPEDDHRPVLRPPRKRGTRIQPDWTPGPDEREFAASLGFSSDQTEQEAEEFRDYWRARAGPQGVKLDWTATWRNWLRKDIKIHGKPDTRTQRNARNPGGFADRKTRSHDEKMRSVFAGIAQAAAARRSPA